jgi:3-oxoadipate enol-lactonase
MPFSEARVGAAGAMLRATMEGPEDAPWLTCLHSLATSSALWDEQVPALSARHRLLRIDARGHGGSDAPAGAYSFPELTADVVAVWDALGVEQSAVLGLSMGGMTAVGLALDHPRRVTGVIAADCRLDAPEFFRAMWQQRRETLAERGMEGIAEVTLPTWLTEETRRTRPDLVARVRAMILGTAPQGYLGAVAALCALDYKRRLGELGVPCLFLCGEADGLHPAEMRTLAQMAAGARHCEIAGAAHLANIERPDAFTAAVQDFLLSPG